MRCHLSRCEPELPPVQLRCKSETLSLSYPLWKMQKPFCLSFVTSYKFCGSCYCAFWKAEPPFVLKGMPLQRWLHRVYPFSVTCCHCWQTHPSISFLSVLVGSLVFSWEWNIQGLSTCSILLLGPSPRISGKIRLQRVASSWTDTDRSTSTAYPRQLTVFMHWHSNAFLVSNDALYYKYDWFCIREEGILISFSGNNNK